MNKTINATDPKSMLKQLAIEFFSSDGNAKFVHWETLRFGRRVDVFGEVKTNQSDGYYILTSAKFPVRCKFHNEITVSATCYAIEDGETVFDCKIEDLGLTKKQLASFTKWVKLWSLDYR